MTTFMATLFLIFVFIAVVVTLYVLTRPYLIEHSGIWRTFCAWLDPLVLNIFTKSRQIAIARLTGLSGILLGLVTTFSDAPIDWTMIGEYVVKLFPFTWQPFMQSALVPLTIWGVGEVLRRITTQPVAAAKE